MVIFVDLAYSEHAETEMLAVSTNANELGFEPGLNSPEKVRNYIDQAEKGGMVPLGEIYETWWKGQFWGAEFETKCYTGKKGGHQPLFDK